MLQTIHGGKPDRFVNQYEAFALVLGIDPFSIAYPFGGEGERWVNPWGVTYVFPKGAPGAMPVHDDEHIVLKSIQEWKEVIKAPCLEFADELWQASTEFAAQVDRDEQFLSLAIAPGLFEQLHHLMGMTNALMTLVLEPEAVKQFIDFLVDWEIGYARQLIERLNPDALCHHDDWGSATSTMMSPKVFRDIFVPAYTKLYGYYKAHGIELIVHHSDSYAATLVPAMIDIGIDIWQGAMSTNDIPALIEQYGGQISFMGGIDDQLIDREDWSPALVAEVVGKACKENGKHYFIPSMLQGMPTSTYPGVHAAVTKEIDRMSQELFRQ